MIQFDAGKFQLGWNHGTTNYSWRKLRFNITFFFTFVFSWRFYLVVQLQKPIYFKLERSPAGAILILFRCDPRLGGCLFLDLHVCGSFELCNQNLNILKQKNNQICCSSTSRMFCLKQLHPGNLGTEARLVVYLFFKVITTTFSPKFQDSGVPWRVPSFFSEKAPNGFCWSS